MDGVCNMSIRLRERAFEYFQEILAQGSGLCIGQPERLRDRWYFSSRHYNLYLKRARERLYKLAQLKKADTADSFL